MIELILLLTRRHVLDTFLFLFIYFLKETTISFNLEKRISFFYIFATFGYGLHPEYLAKTRLTTNNIWSFEFDRQPKELSGKALANEDRLLRTHCCDTNFSPFARTRNICCGHKFCVQDTKKVSDFVQKHFVSAANVSQFAQPKKHHGQQCVLVYQGLKT